MQVSDSVVEQVGAEDAHAGGVLLTSRCDGAVVYGHPAERESLRTSAGLHWKTRDRGGVASCGAHALHVTLVLAS